MKTWLDPTIERLKADQVLANFKALKWNDSLEWLKVPGNRERLEKAAAFKRQNKS
jgi:hypothetical protein